jgi:formylglycine-generating enzyme required for sulfatase activity
MVFRRVDTPARDGPLEDRQLSLGSEDQETGYNEYVRTDFLVGGFTDEQRHVRYYYIGKYDVTRDQYAAVTEAACPQPSAQGRRPAAGLGWYDAVQFTFRYTSWLMQNARDRLPRVGDEVAFVRLPTEPEWEFAARGGAAVSDGDFRQRVFPMTMPMARYVWFQGAQSANGESHPIGQLQPNQLGLFDILGNVSQIVLEPYRLTRGDRLHGQAGGFVARGGDYQTPEARIRSSMRIEYPPFNPETGQPLRLAQLGMRVALAAPVNVGLQQTTALRDAWNGLPQNQPIDPRADAVTLIGALNERVGNGDLREPLANIRQALIADRDARARADDRTARSSIGFAAILIRAVRDFDSRSTSAAALVTALTAMDPNATRLIESQRVQIQAASNNKRDAFNVYMALLLSTAQDIRQETLAAELQTWSAEQTASQVQDMRRFGRLFVTQVERYRRARNADTVPIMNEILQR